MHQSTSRRIGSIVIVVVTLLCSFMPFSYLTPEVYAAPDGTGKYPDSVYEQCELMHPAAGLTGLGIGAVTGSPAGPIGALVGAAIGGIIGTVAGYPGEDVCLNNLTPVTNLFIAAYEEVVAVGINPGVPTSRVEEFGNDMLIQKFTLGNLGDGYGAILMHKSTGTAFYVGGGTWNAYNRAMTENSVLGSPIFPGHPTSFQQEWAGVPIQFFEGGSWGNGAIIGGDQAWLVTGNHWEKYWAVEGWASLGKPLGAVYKNGESKYQQDFEKGNITELDDQTWVNSTSADQIPAELPPAGSTSATSPVDPPQEGSPPTTAASSEENLATDHSGQASSSEPSDSCETGPQLFISYFYAATVEELYRGDSAEIWFGLDNTGCETYETYGIQIYQVTPSGQQTVVFDSGYVAIQPGESFNGDAYVNLQEAGTYGFFIDTYDISGSPYGFSIEGASDAIDLHVNGSDESELVLEQFWASGDGDYSVGDTITITVQLGNIGSGTYSANHLFIMHGISGQPSEYALSTDPFEIAPGQSISFSADVPLNFSGDHSFWFETYDYNGTLTYWTDASGTGNQIYIWVSEAISEIWRNDLQSVVVYPGWCDRA